MSNEIRITMDPISHIKLQKETTLVVMLRIFLFYGGGHRLVIA